MTQGQSETIVCTRDDETVTERKGEEEKGIGREDDYKQRGTCMSACIHKHIHRQF